MSVPFALAALAMTTLLLTRTKMFDCHKDLLAFHDDEVTLAQAQRTTMKERRNSNRDRLKKGLKDAGDPLPDFFLKQGSYAMRTMVQDRDNDYDIDDGVYFAKDKLVGPRGGELSPLQVRTMVRDAVDDGSFKTPPEVRTNCVRVHYAAGYHVDLPVYRVVTTLGWDGVTRERYELAGAEWRESRAADVEEWFDTVNQTRSPDSDNGRQFRRMVRLLKKFAKSRPSWRGRIASGFVITKLAQEKYQPNAAREDRALRDTIRAIRDRLAWDLSVRHPISTGELIAGHDDARTSYLKDRLDEALANLDVLDAADCTDEKAAKAWDKVFNTTFFSERAAGRSSKENATAARFAAGLVLKNGSPPPVHKEGGGRFG